MKILDIVQFCSYYCNVIFREV
uniref:Uncharacterized protein n=1 Tax=Arundo donax TaxID=35708 RepID=A0A0A9A4N9_ARUDO